jgi:hypothetical protein
MAQIRKQKNDAAFEKFEKKKKFERCISAKNAHQSND